MKKQTYMRDIQDTLSENMSSQGVLKLAKKIKSVQKKAFPSIEFKQHLGDRLSNIHQLQLLEDVKPRFSLIQLFTAFASFIFIIGGGVVFMQMQSVTDVYTPTLRDAQIETKDVGRMEIIPEPSVQSDSFESSLYMTEAENVQQVQQEQEITAGELCGMYNAEYDDETMICRFENGTECENYNEQSVNVCALYDASLSEEINLN